MTHFAKRFKKDRLLAVVEECRELVREAFRAAASPPGANPGDICLLVLQEHESAPLAAVAGPLPEDFEARMPSRKPALPAGALLRELWLEGRLEALLVLLAPAGAQPPALAVRALDFCAARLQELAFERLVRRSLGEESLELYREISVLQRAVENLNSSMKFGEVVSALAEECRAAALPADFCLIFDKERRLDLVERLTSESGDLPGEAVTPQQLAAIADSELFADVQRKNRAEVVNDLEADPRWTGETRGLARLLLAPLKGGRFGMGMMVLAAQEPSHGFSSGHLKKATTLASVGSVSLANSYHFEQVQYILMALIKAMATAIDARDRLTAGHSQRVAQYALGLAMQANKDHALCPEIHFSDEELQELFYAGLLHDVGKIGVREEVLTKETRLPRPHLELVGLRLALWGEMGQRPWKEFYARLEIINKALRHHRGGQGAGADAGP